MEFEHMKRQELGLVRRRHLMQNTTVFYIKKSRRPGKRYVSPDSEWKYTGANFRQLPEIRRSEFIKKWASEVRRVRRPDQQKKTVVGLGTGDEFGESISDIEDIFGTGSRSITEVVSDKDDNLPTLYLQPQLEIN